MSKAVKKNRKLNKTNVVVLCLLAVIIAAGIVAAYFMSKTPDSPSKVVVPGTSPVPIEKPNTSPKDPISIIQKDKPLNNPAILIDGWSYKTINSNLQYAKGTEEATGDLRYTSLKMYPLKAVDIETLLETKPDIVQKAVARMVTADTDVTCDSNVCKTSFGELTAEDLANPSSYRGLGEMYGSLKVDALLYYGVIENASIGDTYYFKASGWEPREYVVSSNETFSETEGQESEEETVNDNTIFYIASLGYIGEPDFAWLNKDQPSLYYAELPSTEVIEGTAENAKLYASSMIANSGLATDINASSKLSRSQITAFSSPTVGCVSYTLCYPGLLTTDIVSTESTLEKVCRKEEGTSAYFYTNTREIVFNLKGAKIAQFGSWNTVPANLFDNADKSTGILYKGFPPLTTSKQQYKLSTGILVEAGVEDYPQTLNIITSLAQLNADSQEEYDNSGYSPNNINNYFDKKWELCQ